MKELAAVLCLTLTACSLEDAVNVSGDTQGQIIDPNSVQTYTGAKGLYYSAVTRAASSISRYTFDAGMITDEIQKRTAAPTAGGAILAILDTRQLGPTPTSDGSKPVVSTSFADLSAALIRIQHATGALRLYPTFAPPALLGELHALQGMIEVLLAEGYCSGIPLTKAPYGELFQYSSGLTTTEVLQHAISQFDSALMYGADSLEVATLARVGKGRALLNLGEYAAAATAVAVVPDDARYLLYYISHASVSSSSVSNETRIANREGGNGVVWYPSGNAATVLQRKDSRLVVTATGGTAPIVRQSKYVTGGTTQILASGLEARLIQAEADLRAGGTQWRTTLNALRTNGSFTVAGTDTTWGLGTGRIFGGPLGTDALQTKGVRLLQDPGTPNARIDSLFQDRAFWLYLTGHRQGDLRRLARPVDRGGYGRSVDQVFPWGSYVHGTLTPLYGQHVVIVPPIEEQLNNALYQGCFHLDP